MPVMSSDTITVQLCSGTGPITTQISLPGRLADHGGADHRAAKEMPCAFSGLSTSALMATDPSLLAGAILFTTSIVQHLALPRTVAKAKYLSPPLRGPPALA
ncbi:hypothetical protein CAF53_02075 [Sphingobium sp. LB126]|nr:hypothetical protein CAF53_02075 [Sphingobium sp. LB126]